MTSITEKMRYRRRLCEYALKYGVTKAARRYPTYRKFAYRQLEKYDGSVRSLALRSRKPEHSTKAHTEEGFVLIQRMLKRNCRYNLAEVYARCRAKGYTGSFENMRRRIRKYGYQKPIIKRKSYTNYERINGEYWGDKIKIDIKHVPQECMGSRAMGKQYCRITGIDECSRKKVLKIVKEKSTYETTKYLSEFENRRGLPIKTIRVDNGPELVNDNDKTGKESALDKAAKQSKTVGDETEKDKTLFTAAEGESGEKSS